MPALTEEEASDLALFTLGEAFRRRRYDPAGIDRTHLVKAVFKLADEFDLPITRCWFKFGQFVLAERVSTDRLSSIRASGLGPLSSRVGTELRGLVGEMQSYAEGLVPFFSQSLDDVLPDYYRTEAPEPYREVYGTNFEWVSFCRRLLPGDDLRGQRTHYADSAGEYLTKLHRAVVPYVRDSEARELTAEYTTFLEELVIRYDGLMADSGFDLRGWREFFNRAVSGYVEKVWTLSAAQIAAETMVGPRAEQEARQMLHTASLAGRYREETFEPLRQEAEGRGYLPTEEDLRDLVARARQRAATRAEVVEEMSYLIREGE